MDTFGKALALALQFEGGFVNDPKDPGGATNKGITQKVYDAYLNSKGKPLAGVEYITDEEVNRIYYNNYWLPAKCDRLPMHLAVVHFDTSVNLGVNQAAKLLQRSAGVKADGIIGQGTLLAISMLTPAEVAIQYIIKRVDFYQNLVKSKPVLQKFLKGWLNRCAILKEEVLNGLG